ncbi:S-4TM family putative pore-forming effector [Mariprofundus sp. KV]|uniref:S-4TM family putative pore-forming effector n=1 Tax=Mariprofundus sp. KV TaxID=2608715 RepID=UPI0015A49D7E|nr:S-4TM family putative pore-forming effector [Mariprofundus sp. KV]NWF36663.1 hypothetical protein [Mariprofundus sp. KV]
MNNIPEEQNSPKQLDRLAAQRNLYATAKKIFGVQITLAAPIAIVWTISVLVDRSIVGYAAIWGLTVVLSDILFLTPWQKRLRAKAAKIQELFDCDVLQMPWNEIKAGPPPAPEEVKEQSDRYKKVEGKHPTLVNWYAPVVGELPIAMARLVCQRTNCWWDATQRKRYAAWILGIILFILLLIVGIGLFGGLTVEALFLGAILPLAPAITVGVRQFLEQMESAQRLDELRNHAEGIWAAACCNPDSPEFALKSRSLQNEIFDNRKRTPLVFDWIFKLFRDKYEDQMNYSAEELVQEASRSINSYGSGTNV